ncbi:hypothetical protein Tsubulata_040649 [Turnera subulata]|uniref:COP1-interacting protein 7 n=1 Tax=Turnera subulata TaxID=218843 RepID=A0A9Q0JQ00_9ROSI|nr:hypothetical protein Tsubulata_040649 [Turnera subulata]
MKSNTPLDYAVFQLSPRHSRCELVVSRNGNTEKLASGLVKPFVTHLKVAEEQVAQAVNSIKLEVERHGNAETWFTKGTLERFVRFVSTPEVLEMVNTFDAEMSQLEAARKIYSQGPGEQFSGAGSDGAAGVVGGADATKKELLRAIDVRLSAVRQDLTTAFARASAAGFNPDTVSDLQLFADRFGAHRLNDACTKFISLCQRRSDLIKPCKPGVEDQVVRSSWGSDMSIDDPTEEQSGPRQPQFLNKHTNLQQAGQDQQPQQPITTKSQHHLAQSKPSTFQEPLSSQSSTTTTTTLQGNNNNIQDEKKEEGEEKEGGSTESTPSQTSQHVRRLSVQDRINLFENKQKEHSGGKSVSVGKSGELRRLSSDVASVAAEKAVLRRWSGASDMSIDLGNDKKENAYVESPLGTPSSSSAITRSKSNVFSGLVSEGGTKENETSSSVQIKNSLRSTDQTTSGSGGGLAAENEREEILKGLKEAGSQAHLGSRTERIGVAVDLGLGEEKLKSSFSGEERRGAVKDQSRIGGKSVAVSEAVENVKNQTESRSLQTQIEDVESRNQILSQSQLRGPQAQSGTLSGQFERGLGVKDREVTHKETESNHSASQSRQSLFTREVEHVRKESASSGKEPIEVEDLQVPRMKVQKPFSAGPEQTRKSQVRKEESDSFHGSNRLGFQSKKGFESQESISTPQASSMEQVQRVRQSKGNQELNDELKMKANELEKLFAEHKLRIPSDQSSSTWRAKPNEMQIEQTSTPLNRNAMVVDTSLEQDKNTLLERSGSMGDAAKFSTPPPMKMVDLDYGSSLRQNFSELILSDDSRGKFYETYMQKRDAKLREEWGTKRLEKEAKLKAMQDSLERSRAEMKAKFSGSVDRQNSLSGARQRAEKLRSVHFHSSMKREQPIDSFHNEEDEDVSELPEQNYYGQDRPFTDASTGDGASRSAQNKKLLPNRNLASSTPRTTAPVPRSSAKSSIPISGRRRAQSENPLAQSVPNFSDFRKENTRPSSGVSKLGNRSQGRPYTRSKSTTEETPVSKEEKPRRAQSLRKSTANPSEFKDFTLLNSDDVLFTPSKYDEQSEQNPYDRFSKTMESKSFLRKGNGIGPGAGANVVKLKGSVASETLKDEEEYEESPFEVEDSVGLEREEEEDELEPMGVADCPDTDNAKSRMSQDSDKMDMSGSENGDSVRSLSQIDPSSVAELPASLPSAFHPMGSLQDSPGESPVSWNSRMLHPFSYPPENSDIDASVDSPIGSPASWNSHSLTQTEVDAARMRKKWGSAQKPFLVANSSHHQSRKDVTKGFKRLLKFGRKNRGTEGLPDWVSATTSEGDDDPEDGRDPANRSSEDLRKSRMGFSQNHPSDDGFNESELFNEHVQALHSSIPAPPANFKLRDDHMSGSSIKAPRSFFSLSSFRSKGSDSKPR